MRNFTRRDFLVSAAAATTAATSLRPVPASAQSEYPARPVELICPWSAGGGTDTTARLVAAVLEKELGQPVNVVNRTGGSGVVGHTAIANAKPDGYTLGVITVEIAMMHWQGLTPLNPESYTPLALMTEDLPGVQVNTASPYATVNELADAIKAAPKGQFKASGTGQGGIWHLALVGWLDKLGLPADHVVWVPSQGVAPALQDLAAQGIDFITCSVPESRAMIDAGKVKSLAIMAPERNPVYPDVPTMKEAMGFDVTGFGGWRGVAAPKGLPDEIATKLTAALEKVYNSTEFREPLDRQGLGTHWAAAGDFAAFMSGANEELGKAIGAAGLGKG